MELRGNSLLRNSLYLMSATVVTSLLGYVYWAAAARLYPAHDLGLASAIISAVTLASLISNLGLSSTLISWLPRRLSGHEWSLTLNAALAATAATGLILGLVLTVLLPFLSRQFEPLRTNWMIELAVVSFVPLWTVSQIFDYAFIAERSAGKMLLRNTFFSVVKIPLLIVPVIFVGASALGIVSSWVLATAISLGVAAWALLRLGRRYVPTIKGVRGEVGAMLTTMTGNYLTTLGGALPMFLLPTLVTIRLSATENAYFYTTWIMGGLFFMVSNAVGSSLFAEGSHAEEHLRRNVLRSIRIIGAMLAPAVLIYLLGGNLILSLFGPAYPRHGLGLLLVLTASAIPDAITNLYVATQRVRRRLRYSTVLNLLMATVTLVLAWFLLPVFGIIGAGLAWLIGETVGSAFVGIHLAYSGIRSSRLDAPPTVEPSLIRDR